MIADGIEEFIEVGPNKQLLLGITQFKANRR